MTPLLLLAAVLAVVIIVGVVAVVLLRRRTPAGPTGPRTVAELVELRSATGGSVAPAAPVEPEPAPAHEEPAPAPEEAPATEPVPVVAADPEPVAEDRPEPVVRLGDDVPWRRGELMNGSGRRSADRSPAPSGASRPAPPPAAERDRRLRAGAAVGGRWRTEPAITQPEPAAAPVEDRSSGAGAAAEQPRTEPVVPEAGEDADRRSGADAAGGGRRRTEPPITGSEPLRPTAEQAAADLALLRTFGAAELASRPDRAPDVALAGAARPGPEEEPGVAQPVRFRVVRRGGDPIEEVAVALLDAAGREIATAKAAAGELTAPRPGSFVLVATADGHEAGAVALDVTDGPVDAELLLVRSAVLRGVVTGEDGPVAEACVTLVQDGEVVDTADSDDDGRYRVEGLAGGEYAVSVAAAGCEPDVELVLLPDGTEVVHDVDLVPVGVVAAWRVDRG